MLSRRQFLVDGSCAAGAWLVGARLVRLISRLATENDEPYLVAVDHPQFELWATWFCDEYIFTLGCPYKEMAEPQLTWSEWLDRKGVDVSKEKEVREFLEEWGWYCPEDGDIYVPPQLDAKLPPELQQDYSEWEYIMHEAPTALAYSYLQRLDLADREADGEGLGVLEFLEGPFPGNNARLVSTKSVALLGGLQQRLLQLGERVRVNTDII